MQIGMLEAQALYGMDIISWLVILSSDHKHLIMVTECTNHDLMLMVEDCGSS